METEESLFKNKEDSHFKEVCGSFANYLVTSMKDILRIQRDFSSLSNYFLEQLIFDYKERLETLKVCVKINYDICIKIIKDNLKLFNHKFINDILYIEPIETSFQNISKVRSTLKLFVRDWSIEGKEEREACHYRMVKELKKYLNPENNSTNSLYKVLVPGAGLGRLVFELCKNGYNAEGNEFSYFMLLSSNFILNSMLKKEELSIYPFIHNLSNSLSNSSALREIKIPDIDLMEDLNSFEVFNKAYLCKDTECSNNHVDNKCPSSRIYGEMSMVAGEFIETYKIKHMEDYNAVLTQYFIDTAHNIIDYIETVYSILKTGGIWINFGPLLYHYSEMSDELSIELSWEEIRKIIVEKYYFKIINEEIIETTYSSDSKSMMKTVYKCIFFTAVKQ